MRYLVIDTETSNLNPPTTGGGVCELSVRELDGDFNLVNHWHSRLDPECAISPSASGVHGILDEHVVDCPTMDEYLDEVVDFNPFSEGTEPIYFIAFNAPFDWRFMARYIKCEAKLADVLVLARRFYPDSPDHKMQTLRVLHRLPFDVADAHSAAGDTQTLVHLLQHMSESQGMTLDELCVDSLRKEPIVKFPFGKHKSKLIADVVKTDRGYLEWCLAKMDSLQPDMRQALEAALAN